LKVTSKNGKTASVSKAFLIFKSYIFLLFFTFLIIYLNIYIMHFPQPVGFVTFHTRAGAEAAKQDLQVTIKTKSISIPCIIERTPT